MCQFLQYLIIIFFMMVPRLRASSRHGGGAGRSQGFFSINDVVIDPPRGFPFGGGGVHHTS